MDSARYPGVPCVSEVINHGSVEVRWRNNMERLPEIAAWLVRHAGLLMSCGPNQPDLYRRAASYVDTILRGSTPAELPVEQPSRFELIINQKTAKVLGVTILQS